MHFMALFGYESGSDIVAYLQEEIIVGKREKKEKKIRKTRKKQGIGLEMKIMLLILLFAAAPRLAPAHAPERRNGWHSSARSPGCRFY